MGTRHHVLVVEDHPDSAEMFAAFLRSLGHLVTVASDGVSALDLAASARPTVAIVDINLGEMDGFSLARQLRAQLGATLPVFALSAYSSADHRRQASELGFNGYFVKPADLDEIEAALGAL